METSNDTIIARTEGLFGEPLLTQWLVFLLERYEFREYIIALILKQDMPNDAISNLVISGESCDSVGCGRPDIEILGENLHIIIENKFEAGLTKNQPKGYLKILQAKRIANNYLVFLTPKARCREVADICRASVNARANQRIKFIAWEDLAEGLAIKFSGSELINEFYREILRRCKMLSPISSDSFAKSISTLTECASQRDFLKAIRNEMMGNPIFRGLTYGLENTPTLKGEECFMGVSISSVGELVFWIGFWNILQKHVKEETPVVGLVYLDSKWAKKNHPRFWKSLKKMQATGVVSKFVPGQGWPIPIPVNSISGKNINDQAKKTVDYFAQVLNGMLKREKRPDL